MILLDTKFSITCSAAQCLPIARHIIAICSVPSETANGVTTKCVAATNITPSEIEMGNAGNAFWNTPRNISVKHSPWPRDAEQSEPGGYADGRVRMRSLAERTMRIATKEAVAVATPYLEPLATSTL